VDTRQSIGSLGGPALAGTSVRLFAVAGSCGIPTNAKSISANVTIINPDLPGDLRIYPGDISPPVASSINFSSHRTRANNLIVTLSSDGLSRMAVMNDSSGTVDILLDVNGYFR
jgi:hypothetical protein